MKYLDTQNTAIVNNGEYNETVINLARIAKEIYHYVQDFKNHQNRIHMLHPKEWDRRYKRSTLLYFTDLL